MHPQPPINQEELDAAWSLFEWNGSLRITAKLGDSAVTGGVLRNKTDLYRAVRNLEEGGWDIYVGANPSRGTRIKAATREVEVWRYVVLDLDPVDPECPAELAISSVLREASSLVANIFEAANIVDTGRGAQAWISLNPTDLRDASQRSDAERAMGALLHRLRVLWQDTLGYRVDTSTSDLARIVRCPGTINTKTGRRARVVRTGQGMVGTACIRSLAGPAPPEPEPLINCSNLNVIAPHLNDRARKFLRMGVQEGERHKSAYAAAANLRELGVEYDKALLWIIRGGQKCFPKLVVLDCTHATNEAWKGR